MAADLLNEPILPLGAETLDGLHTLLSNLDGQVSLSTALAPAVALPDELRRVLAEVVDAMRRGQAISIVPSSQRLTTQEAADLLGVSRPTLVKLLESGAIAYESPGRHRRVRLTDLLTYRDLRRSRRRATLDELTQDAGELGLAEALPQSYEAALADARAKLA